MSAALIATQWTTPLSSGQRPWIMWADWQDIIAYVDLPSIRVSDTSGASPAVLEFTCTDRTNAVGALLRQQGQILYLETGAAQPVLYRGFVKFLEPTIIGPYAQWKVTCSDVSELLDVSHPIEQATRPVEGDQSRIGAALAYSTLSGLAGGGFIQSLNAALDASDWSHMSVRAAIEEALQATGVPNAGYYVDMVGPWLHTYLTADAGAAPFAISDAPNYTTTIPAKLELRFDGSSDTDAVHIYGGTAAGSGPVQTTAPPRFPHRVRPIDYPGSLTSAGKAAAGAYALANGQIVTSVKITVSADAQHGNFGGWAKGQSLAVTNAVLGWVAKPLIIQAVEWRFLNGLGHRRYILTCGAKPVSAGFVRFGQRVAAAASASRFKRQHASAIGGRVGSASLGPG